MVTFNGQVTQAAKSWIQANPNQKVLEEEIAQQITGNVRKAQKAFGKPCASFDYSGTPWCDKCGFMH